MNTDLIIPEYLFVADAVIDEDYACILVWNSETSVSKLIYLVTLCQHVVILSPQESSAFTCGGFKKDVYVFRWVDTCCFGWWHIRIQAGCPYPWPQSPYIYIYHEVGAPHHLIVLSHFLNPEHMVYHFYRWTFCSRNNWLISSLLQPDAWSMNSVTSLPSCLTLVMQEHPV